MPPQLESREILPRKRLNNQDKWAAGNSLLRIAVWACENFIGG